MTHAWPENLSLREPQESEIDSLTALYTKLRAEVDLRLLPDYFRAFPKTFLRDNWRYHFDNPDTTKAFVLSCGSEEIGLIHFGKFDDGNSPFLTKPLPEDVGELYQIYLFAAYHGRGYGRFLYEAARKGLRKLGHRAMLICTYRENDAAKDFYLHMGARVFEESALDMNFDGVHYLRPVSFFLHEEI